MPPKGQGGTENKGHDGIRAWLKREGKRFTGPTRRGVDAKAAAERDRQTLYEANVSITSLETAASELRAAAAAEETIFAARSKERRWKQKCGVEGMDVDESGVSQPACSSGSKRGPFKTDENGVSQPALSDTSQAFGSSGAPRPAADTRTVLEIERDREPFWWLPGMLREREKVEQLRADCPQALSADLWESVLRKCRFAECKQTKKTLREYKAGTFEGHFSEAKKSEFAAWWKSSGAQMRTTVPRWVGEQETAGKKRVEVKIYIIHYDLCCVLIEEVDALTLRCANLLQCDARHATTDASSDALQLADDHGALAINMLPTSTTLKYGLCHLNAASIAPWFQKFGTHGNRGTRLRWRSYPTPERPYLEHPYLEGYCERAETVAESLGDYTWAVEFFHCECDCLRPCSHNYSMRLWSGLVPAPRVVEGWWRYDDGDEWGLQKGIEFHKRMLGRVEGKGIELGPPCMGEVVEFPLAEIDFPLHKDGAITFDQDAHAYSIGFRLFGLEKDTLDVKWCADSRNAERRNVSSFYFGALHGSNGARNEYRPVVELFLDIELTVSRNQFKPHSLQIEIKECEFW
jgi:hypothetical protein